MATHPFIALLSSPSASREQIDAFIEGDPRAVDAMDPHTRRTALHVLCANVCLVDDDSVEHSSVLLLAGHIPAALSARDLQGATPLDLLVDHAGLTTPLLLRLVALRPELAREKLRIGSWWEQRRDNTPLHWVCAQGDADSSAVADVLAAERKLPSDGAADGGVAAAVDSWTGRSALHVLCDNEQLIAHNWADFLKALRALAAAAPRMVARVDRQGHKPCDLLERQHLLRGEALAILVKANPDAAASRLALPPWEQSEWTTRKPPANAAAEEEALLGKEQMREREQRAENARGVFEELIYSLVDPDETESTAAAIKVRRLYEQGDSIVRQAAVDVHQLCSSLVKLLHHPRCSAPRSAAQRTLACLGDGDGRLKERIKGLKLQEMEKVKEVQREMREQGRTESVSRFPAPENEPEPYTMEPEPEPEPASKPPEAAGTWRYEKVDGEWEYLPPGADAAAEAAKPNYLQLEELLEQSHLAQSRKEGLKKLEDLTQAYRAALIKLIMADEASKIDNQDYLDMKQRELEAMGVAQVRDECVDRALDAESVTWLRGRIGELIPSLLELLRDLEEDKDRLAALQTIKQIVGELARDRSFLHALPQLTAAIFFLKCGQDGLVFNAANQCLDDIIACSTHRRLVNIAEEAVGVTNEDRVRDRAMNCLLQMLLQWPVAKLERQETQFQRILLVVMNSRATTTRHMRKIARRAAMVCLRRLPRREAQFRAEMGPKRAVQVEKEELWALAQLRKCTFSIANVADSAVIAEPSSEEEEEEQEEPEEGEEEEEEVQLEEPEEEGKAVQEEDSIDKIDASMGQPKTKAQLVAKTRWKKVKLAALVTAAGYRAAVQDSQRTTPLHWLCASSTVALRSLKSLLEVLTLESRLAEDAYRRTPLHVLCANRLVTGAMLQAMLSGLAEPGQSAKRPSKETSVLHLDETRRTPLHCLCSNRRAWLPEKIDVVAAVAGQWTGWDRKDGEGRAPLDLLAANDQLDATVLEALVGHAGEAIAKLSILTRPDQPHAPITMDESNTCSVSPLHWLCMQHTEASARADTVPLSTLQVVVDAFPEAAAIQGPEGNTPLHLLCMGKHTTTAHLLAISGALSSCWEERNDHGDRPLDLLVAARKITPAKLLDLIKHTPRIAEVPMKDIRNAWSKEPLTVLHWLCHTISTEPEPGVQSSLLGSVPGSDHRELLMDVIFKHEQIDHEDTWRAALEPLKKIPLRKRAMSEGVPAAELAEAEDSYDPKAAVIDLIVARLKSRDDAGEALNAEIKRLRSEDIKAEMKSHKEGSGAQDDRAPWVSVLHNRAVVVCLKCVLDAFPDAVVRLDEEGRTPLHIYCTHSGAFAEAITVLTEQMADFSSRSLHSRDLYSNSALDLLSAHGALSVDLLQEMVRASSIVATVEMKDTHGPACDEFGPGHVMKLADHFITPLHWLCAQPNLTLEALEVVMVSAGSSAARVDGRGQTPLHYLCRNAAWRAGPTRRRAADVSKDMLALFQKLNEDRPTGIDSKEVLLSQASAEAVVGRDNADGFHGPSAGDEARAMFDWMNAEETDRATAQKEQQVQLEKERRRAAQAAAAAPRAVHQAQKLVDRRAKTSAQALKKMSGDRSKTQQRRGLRGASFGKPLPEPQTISKGKQHRSFPEPRVPKVHFFSSKQRPHRAEDPREQAHHSMAHIITGMADGPTQRNVAHKRSVRNKTKGVRRRMLVEKHRPSSVVDWAAIDSAGMTALHLLCTAPSRSTRALLRWAAETPATTDAWSVSNRDGRTPLDVLQFTCKDPDPCSSDPRYGYPSPRFGSDSTAAGGGSLPAAAAGGERLTARLLQELVFLSQGRLATVPLRALDDLPEDRMADPPTPGDVTILEFACADPNVAEKDVAEIVYAHPLALVHVSGRKRRNPLHVLCANPRGRPAHISCLVLSPCGREAAAAQDADGNTALHLLCQNPQAVCVDACAALVAEYTPVISMQNALGRLPIHYAASLGATSELDEPELEELLKMLSVAPRAPGRKRPKRGGGRTGLAPTRDVFGRTPLEHLARNGNVDARLVGAVGGGVGKLGVSRNGRSDALIGERPIGAVGALLACGDRE